MLNHETSRQNKGKYNGNSFNGSLVKDIRKNRRIYQDWLIFRKGYTASKQKRDSQKVNGKDHFQIPQCE